MARMIGRRVFELPFDGRRVRELPFDRRRLGRAQTTRIGAVALALLLALGTTGCKLFGVTHPPNLGVGDTPDLFISSTKIAPSTAVELRFDERGIPHIYAETETDASYALGFAHARDRLFQIEVLRHAASGRLTELFGESLLEVDRQLRLVALRPQAQLDAMTPRDRGIVDAYVAGVNDGAEYAGDSAAEFVLTGRTFTPFSALDVVAISRMHAWELSHDLFQELARARILSRLPASDPRSAALLRPVPSNGVPVLARSGASVIPDAPAKTSPANESPANESPANESPATDDDGGVGVGAEDALDAATDVDAGPASTESGPDAADAAPGNPAPTTGDATTGGVTTGDADASAGDTLASDYADPPNPASELVKRLSWFFRPPDVEARAKVEQWTKADRDPSREFLHLFGAGAGSNAWAVSGGQTASGFPILVADPHLRHSAPSILYTAHIEVKEKGGGVVVGTTFPGIPAVTIGYTDHLSWTLTTSYADTQDLVRIQEDPSRPDVYIVDGQRKKYGTLTQTYTASGQTLLTETWKTTIFGPVLPGGYEHLKEPGEEFALSWTGFDPEINRANYSAFWDLLYAVDVNEAFAAVDQLGTPSQNALFAFTDGTIAYRLLGALPKRQSGAPSDRPREGTTSSANWAGSLEQDRRPSLVNPPWGILIAANQRLTADNDPLASFVGRAGAAPYRAERIAERLDDVLALGPASAEDLLGIQQDVHSIEARLLAPVFTQFCPRTLEGLEPFVITDFCNALASFDGNYFRGSSGALAFTWLLEALQQEVLTVHLGDDVGRQLAHDPATTMALEHAFLEEAAGRESPLLDDLRTPHREGLKGFVARATRVAIYRMVDALGEDAQEWRWGRVHTLQVDGFIADAPLIGYFFFGDATEQDGHSNTIRAETGTPVRHGAVMRMVSEMKTPPEVRMVLDLGQSGHRGADNERDQFPDWNAGIPLVIETDRRKLDKKTGTIRLEPKPGI